MIRVTVTMNDKTVGALRNIQSDIIKETKQNLSFSRVVGAALVVGLNDKKTIKEIIKNDRKNH